MDIKIERATIEDTDSLIQAQNKAFYSDYKKYGYCPGYNRTYESMRGSVVNCITFKIMNSNNIIGDIIVSNKGDGNYYLGGLCVVPEYENQGIGQKAIQFIDSYFSDAKHWSLETPADKKRNHYFYKKCGFHITKEYMDDNVKVVLFEKKI